MTTPTKVLCWRLDALCGRCHATMGFVGVTGKEAEVIADLHVCADGVRPKASELFWYLSPGKPIDEPPEPRQ